MISAREIHLVRRPTGMVVEGDFAVVETKTPEIGDGEIQIAAEILSVDPYMRPRLNADQPLNAPLVGRGIGRVVGQSKHSASGFSFLGGASPRPEHLPQVH